MRLIVRTVIRAGIVWTVHENVRAEVVQVHKSNNGCGGWVRRTKPAKGQVFNFQEVNQ